MDVTQLFAIDHDNAFDQDFSIEDFRTYHLGRKAVDYWRVSIHRENWINQAKGVIREMSYFWSELPDEWVYSDLDNEISPRYTLEYYESFLRDSLNNPEEFWKGLLP